MLHAPPGANVAIMGNNVQRKTVCFLSKQEQTRSKKPGKRLLAGQRVTQERHKAGPETGDVTVLCGPGIPPFRREGGGLVDRPVISLIPLKFATRPLPGKK